MGAQANPSPEAAGLWGPGHEDGCVFAWCLATKTLCGAGSSLRLAPLFCANQSRWLATGLVLAHSLTHSVIHLFHPSLAHSFSYLFTHSFTHSFTRI